MRRGVEDVGHVEGAWHDADFFFSSRRRHTRSSLVSWASEMCKRNRYYTSAQLSELEQRAEEIGEERMRAVQQEWTELFAAYQRAM